MSKYINVYLLGIVQICDRVHITKYVDREWKGQTDRANTIRKVGKIFRDYKQT